MDLKWADLHKSTPKQPDINYLPKEQREESGYEAHREQTSRGLVWGHSTFSGLFLQDLRQLVVAAEQLHNVLKAAFTVTDGGKHITM